MGCCAFLRVLLTLYFDAHGKIDVITKEAYMSNKLKNVIYWTVYIIVILVLVGLILIPSAYALIMAVFLKKAEEISEVITYISILGVIGSVASLALAILSTKQASDSSKRMEDMSNNLKIIKETADRRLNKVSVIRGSTEDKTWENEPQDERLE